MWEFCHPLFRRGEPHLLASMKRKSTRPTGQEDEHFASSIEEQATPSAKAGWMHDASPGPLRAHSQPKDNRVSRRQIYEEETQRHAPTGSTHDSAGAAFIGRPPPLDPINKRSRPDPIATLPSARTDLRHSPYGSQASQLSGAEALSFRVSVLEDQIQQLADLLHNERIDHLRSSLDLTSYLSRMNEWTEARQRHLSAR